MLLRAKLAPRCARNGGITWQYSSLTLFIGFNCLQSSFTGFCPPVWVMRKFDMKTEAELALEKIES
ncbi:MAG TPA: hypothetical protein DDW45_05120 [Gammaproteobacteria bacterium]|nr:hypothetical protein [Gammaproteobacteria bacterium]